MRIGMLSTSFPDHPGDHAGAFVHRMARALVEGGHTVELAVPATPGATVLDGPGIRVHRIRSGPTGLLHGHGALENLAHRPWLALQAPPFLAALASWAAILAGRCSLLVSHWIFPTALVAGAMARLRAKPHVAIMHSGGLHLLRRLPGHTALAGLTLHGAHRVVASSHYLKDLWLSTLPSRRSQAERTCLVQPMGIDVAAFDGQPRVGQGGPLEVRYLGRLVPIKGIETLLRAVALSGLPLRLRVAGAGPEEAGLRALARELGVLAMFVGPLGPEGKAAFLSGADIVALPSLILPGGRTEGLPQVLLEAMASARPVVASAVGGVPEMVEGTGLLVPPGDAAALAQALRKLALDPEMRYAMGLRARRRAAALDWTTHVGPWFCALFERVVQEHGASRIKGPLKERR